MTKQSYQLPGLTQLASFEAAARHLSFKKAAQELEVTTSAISHQIRALEDNLSSKVFKRAHRKVLLTDAGRMLYEQLRRSFSSIGEISETIRAQSAENTATISVDPTIAKLWLKPMISHWKKEYPDYLVEVRPFSRHDPQSIDPGLSLSFEDDLPENGSIALFRDALVPVASPDFVKRYNVNSLSALARVPLIEVENHEKRWMQWSHWFKALGYLGDVKYSEYARNSMEALASARAGAGVMLALRKLVEPLVIREELAILSDYSLEAEAAYGLYSRKEALSATSQKLNEWLLQPSIWSSEHFFLDQ